MKRAAEAILNQLFTVFVPGRIHARTDLHLARKIWHMTMGFSGVAIYLTTGMSRLTAVMILGVLLVINLSTEITRLRFSSFNQKFIRFWGPLLRTCEVNKFSGVPYYLVSMMLAVVIFPKSIAMLSILYLACGDPAASLAGIMYGSRSYRFSNGKSLVGTAAGVAVCTLITFIYLSQTGLRGFELAVLTVTGGLAGGLAELLPLEVDDNFSIPVVSGFVLWLAFIILGV
ncbi:MAG: hypothetical protein A2583_11990 [Bdellovibrionales bacterium RIFOXYD1_FULL_53_11]|nr:MAG: hypothetical protein A2583_11990 [Bdellovibrionales bacterium RIFOXYD1_FULL_53_11]